MSTGMRWLLLLVLLSGCQRSNVDQELLLQIRECDSGDTRVIMIDGKIICRPYEGNAP